MVSTGERVAVCVSPAFTGGLFWARAPAGLVFSDSVRELVASAGIRVAIDPDFIRRFAVLSREMAATRTAFAEINRVVPGTTEIWDVHTPMGGSAQVCLGRPRTVVWCGPDAWPEPHLQGSGAPHEYLAAFDASIDDLLDEGPLYVLMSGGLDSTFLAASLVRHATPDRPLHALCHSPDPGACLSKQGVWDPDDYPVARLMEDAYPGRLVVHRVHPPVGSSPLDAAAQVANARGVPTLNPGNQVWMTHAAQLAADAGATRLFCGTNGNSAYSGSHDYASGYYLQRGDFGSAWRSLVAEDRRLPSKANLRARAARPAIHSLRRHLPATARHHVPRRITGDSDVAGYRSLVGLRHLGPGPVPRLMTRAGYLDWLTGHGPYGAATMFAGSPVPIIDPFSTQRMLDTAAALTPLEWLRGPGDSRTYARLLAAGRVPDAIRMRTRRGGQAWDEWYLIRNERDRYVDEVAALATTPILGGWVDDASLRDTLDGWPWGQVHGPNRMAVLAMNRILSLAAFVRAATGWIHSTTV